MLKTQTDIKQEILSKLDRPLVLIGLMGAGKTRIGRMLAQTLQIPFTDSDDEIEKAAGCSVSDIFQRFGENYFRDGERRVIKRLLKKKACVISTGGGAIMAPETAKIIWNNSISIWIKADMQTTLSRVSKNLEKRPMLTNGNPETILEDLMKKRYPVYEKADIHLTSIDMEESNIIQDALNAIYNHVHGKK